MNKYSQYNEEIFLNQFFGDNIGFLAEIGAADGISNSNSRMLIEKGWSGVLVEPNIYNFQKLELLYNNNKSILLENLGCSDNTIKSTFYIDHNDEYQQISSFDLSWVEKCKRIYNCRYEEVSMDLVKASDIFERHEIHKIDFLSIDTEGFDDKVIRGIDFDKVEIILICTEHESTTLVELGYKICHKTYGNIFYSKS